MRKLWPAFLISMLFLSYCNTAKKASTTPVIPKLTYEADIKNIITSNCSPCHIPEKGGNKAPFITYIQVTDAIDNMISRIQMHPGERGFMPFKRERLSDSLINVFKQWKTDGVHEK